MWKAGLQCRRACDEEVLFVDWIPGLDCFTCPTTGCIMVRTHGDMSVICTDHDVSAVLESLTSYTVPYDCRRLNWTFFDHDFTILPWTALVGWTVLQQSTRRKCHLALSHAVGHGTGNFFLKRGRWIGGVQRLHLGGEGGAPVIDTCHVGNFPGKNPE